MSTFIRLAPELSNAIYTLLLSSSNAFFVMPAMQTKGEFKLSERSGKSQYDILEMAVKLSRVNRDLDKKSAHSSTASIVS